MDTIVQAAGLLLMTRSAPSQFLLMLHRDRLDLPKGHVEAGEEILQAALRETEEETGIGPHLIDIAPDFHFVLEYEVSHSKRGHYRKRVTYFLGFVESALEVQLSEHEGYRWFEWPVQGSLQLQTIDPLLAAVASHFAKK